VDYTRIGILHELVENSCALGLAATRDNMVFQEFTSRGALTETSVFG